MLSLLRRFEPMANFDWHSLATLARLATELAVPRKRLLVRPPRRLRGVWYLCSGSLVNELTGERLVAGSKRCRRPIYPGHLSLRCVTAARLLHFDNAAVEEFDLLGELNIASNLESEQNLNATNAAWIEALAGSPVLRLLYQRHGASGWQRWLRELSSVSVARDEPIVAPGYQTDFFYIVQSGVAFVDDVAGRQVRPLARVFAGGFFGEDAVLTGRPRNARVHMPLGGRVLCGSGEQLQGLVADVRWALARGAKSRDDHSTPLLINQAIDVQSLRSRLDSLIQSEAYALCVDEDNALQNLALLLLMHRGFRVVLRDAR